MAVDLKADAKPQASPTDLAHITTLARELLRCQREGEKLEAKAKEWREKARMLEETTIPEAMDKCGMTEFKLTGGYAVSIAQVVAGSIPAKNKDAALDWLRRNGHGGLIKAELSVAFGKGMEALASKAKAALAKLGVEATSKETVHPQTLGAWAREQLAEGEDVPTELLGIWVGRRAKLQAPKKP